MNSRERAYVSDFYHLLHAFFVVTLGNMQIAIFLSRAKSSKQEKTE